MASRLVLGEKGEEEGDPCGRIYSESESEGRGLRITGPGHSINGSLIGTKVAQRCSRELEYVTRFQTRHLMGVYRL